MHSLKLHQVNQRNESTKTPLIISVNIEEVPHTMELDTGAAVSLISKKTYQSLWSNKTLEKSTTKLKTYSGESIGVCGYLQVKVDYEDQQVYSIIIYMSICLT